MNYKLDIPKIHVHRLRSVNSCFGNCHQERQDQRVHNVVATVLRLEVVLLCAFANHQSHYYNSHINNAAEKKRPHIWNDPLLDSGMWNQSFRDF
jgi:hypothetical protein